MLSKGSLENLNMKACFIFSSDCLVSWVARGANMDTLIFNLCHRPSANTQAAGAKFGLRSALSSGMPDSIQAKTHSILSNFEFTQKKACDQNTFNKYVSGVQCFCGTGSIGKALPTSWRPPVPSCKVRESGPPRNMYNMYKLAGET